MSDLVFLSASEMAESVRKRQVSPVELVRAHLAQIDRVNPRLNAIVSLNREGALAEARQAEAAVMRGDSVGPLHGVPSQAQRILNPPRGADQCGHRNNNCPPESICRCSRL